MFKGNDSKKIYEIYFKKIIKMRLSYSLGSLLTVEQVLACSRKLNEFKPDTVWIPETWGMENFSMKKFLQNN